MGTCGQPGYVFRDFCLKQGIEFIIFCLNQGIDLSIFMHVLQQVDLDLSSSDRIISNEATVASSGASSLKFWNKKTMQIDLLSSLKLYR